MIFHSSFETIYLLLPIIGFIIGMFGTMLGGGGGFFFLPVLTLIIGAPPHVAVATSLAATLPICIIGSFGHYRKGNIELKTGGLFVATGIIGAFMGAGITGLLTARQLKVSFGIYAVLIAFSMAYSTWKKKKAEQNGEGASGNTSFKKITKGSVFGLSAGLIAGTFGTSGTAPVIAGLFAMRLPLKLVIGTSLLVVLVNTLFAVSAHFLVGQIDLTLVWFLTAGSAIGALVGTRVLAKANVDRSENNIRYVYALVMVAIGVLMMINK
uniref:sulfite exporter TauE/SafE family protein n=1 Tax=uncultured Draconibacterium sp. TaxID=1573823 RepID=UPI00321781D4